MNQYNPNIHHRRSMRLQGYDYAQAGLYFITICCQDRACLFGAVVDGHMKWNHTGHIANECWQSIPTHFPNAVLHEYIVMPNHVHGIIEIKSVYAGAENVPPYKNPFDYISKADSQISIEINPGMDQKETDKRPDKNEHEKAMKQYRANGYSPPQSPSQTIGSIVRGFKIGVTKWVRQNTAVHQVWQRNYHEHIIRDERSYQNIAAYIVNNPAKWADDRFKN